MGSLDAGRLQNGSWGYPLMLFWRAFGASWLILGAILGQAGRHGAPKIYYFGVKVCQKLQK